MFRAKQENELAPICLFLYNRPNHTRKTLNQLQKAKHSSLSKLYIFCDGPKASATPEEIEKIQKVHNIAHEISGFQEVRIVKQTSNLGLGKSIIKGVTQVLSQFENVIIIEDDHLVHEDFLIYMNFYLQNYKEDKRIMHIGAFARNSYLQFFLPRVYLTRYMDCWGWATWSDKWAMLKLDYKLFDEYFSIKHNRDLYNFKKLDHHTYLDKNKDEINTWAVFWHATIAIYNGLCIMPKYSYVKNIGNDGSGSNNVVNVNELSSNFVRSFKEFCPKIKENYLGELYIKDAYAKRSKKRFNRLKRLIHNIISALRNKNVNKI
jgi:hypothetical protein